MESKQLGIVLVVLGGGIGLWVYTRFTSLMGKMCSWSPPFSSFEAFTLIGAIIALVLITFGLIMLTSKPKT